MFAAVHAAHLFCAERLRSSDLREPRFLFCRIHNRTDVGNSHGHRSTILRLRQRPHEYRFAARRHRFAAGVRIRDRQDRELESSVSRQHFDPANWIGPGVLDEAGEGVPDIATRRFAGDSSENQTVNAFRVMQIYPLYRVGAMAVDFLSMKLVCSAYSVPFDMGSCRSTSARSASNASLASSACDICTVVKGGNMNRASRTSSKPTSDKSRGMTTPSS